MRLLGLLLALLVASVVLAGCASPRDIESEAKEREAWARDHNAYDPIAILSGPDQIAPGALVWYSAHGSHDPDFFGAKRDREREEAHQDGGVHVTDDATHVHWTWSIHLDEDRNDGLGNGIRRYEWIVDDGPPLVAHELTHRYGSQDGPLRFPLGFTEPGTHTLTLRVVDWSGEVDTVSMTIDVADGGVASTVPGWSVTEQGWVHEHTVPVTFEQYGDCPMLSRGHYDPKYHHMSIPWDLFFFMDTIQVEAEWERLEAPAPAVAADSPAGLDGLLTEPVPDAEGQAQAPGLNLNDIALTFGHCETGDPWVHIDADQDLMTEAVVEHGEVTGEEAARNVEITGSKTERSAEYDINVYLSDRGSSQWGKGGDVLYRTIFVPATDTSYGGQ